MDAIPSNDFLDLSSIIIYDLDTTLSNTDPEENPLEFATLSLNANSLKNVSNDQIKKQYNEAYALLKQIPISQYTDNIVQINEEWSGEFVSAAKITVLYRYGQESGWINEDPARSNFAYTTLTGEESA